MGGEDKEVEQLLKLLEEGELPTGELPNTIRFINDLALAPNPNERVDGSIIYYFYLLWCNEKNLKPESIRTLYRHLADKFKKYKPMDVTYFYTDANKFFLTEEEMIEYKREKFKDREFKSKSKMRKAEWQKRKRKEKQLKKQKELKEKLLRKHGKSLEKNETSLDIPDSKADSSQK